MIYERTVDGSPSGAFEHGIKVGLERAAKLLDVSRSEMLLACGEMTAQEVRSVKAVLAWRQRIIRDAIDD